MKPILSLFLLMMALTLASAADGASATKPVRKGKLVHVVAFKFKPTATQTEIDNLISAFGALPKKIKQIGTYEWGTNVSPEQHDKGFTHCFVLSFKSDQDRDEYLVHPDHKAFGNQAGPVVADVFVVDYWARK